MNYLKEKCPVCEKEFTQEDDTVVCPVCGTPHHRECYESLGRCKNEALHSEGFEWTPSNTNETVQAENDGHQIIFCPNCGRENPASEPVCLNCGERLYNNLNGSAPRPVMLPNMQNEQFSDNVIRISPDDTIGDNKVSDVAEFVQLNANRYIPKFYKMEKTGKKLSFNWASFFFSPYWFFFRKMHVTGFIIMLISILITGVCTTDRVTAFTKEYTNAVGQYYAGEISDEEFAEISNKIVELPEIAVMSVSGFAIKLFCGLFGNYLYKKKVEKEIGDCRQNASSPEEYRFMLFKRGGISGIMCGLSIVGYYCADQILTMLLLR